MSKLIQEFKDFAVKGNAIDMAIGVIIGGAFGKIVTSIVDDLLMPPIGWLIGGVNFSDLKYTLPAKVLGQGITTSEATINYGNFIQQLINFIIIAICMFAMVKLITKLKTKEEAPQKPAEAPKPSAQEQLLAEIRDLLKKEQK